MSFELQPTLEGELILLRPIKPEDYEALYTAASDPLIWEVHPNWDRYKPENFKRYFQGAIDSGGAFIVIDKANGKIIGSSRYHHYDADDRSIHIGWTFLERAYWGGRHNGELKRLMLTHAFQFVDTAIFVIGPDNVRSRRAIEKIGGILVGTCLDDDRRESVMYHVTKGKAVAMGANTPLA